MQVKKQQLELDMEQQTGSKLGKEYVKSAYCHPAYLTYRQYIMRNARLDEAQARIKIAGREPPSGKNRRPLVLCCNPLFARNRLA